MAAGSIVIDLLMKTGSFETDTNRASKSLAKFKKDAIEVGKAVGLAFTAFAAAAAAGVKASIDNADAIAKMAQAAGTSVEVLSSMAYAADLAGVNQETLGSAFVKLTKNMSDASQGIGEAGKAFDALGLSVKDSAGNLKPAETAITEIADKFAKFEDGAEKTALAVALFGKSGAQLIPFLNQGKDGIEALREEADRLGITLSTDAAKASEAFNDNLTRINGISKGLFNSIAQELLPSMVNLTDQFFNTASGAQTLDNVARAAASGIKILASIAVTIGGIFKTIGNQIGATAAILVQFFQGNFKQAFNIARESTGDFVENIKSTIGSVAAIWDDTARTIESQAPMLGEKLAAPIIKAQEKTAKAAKSMRDDVEKQIKSIFTEIAKLEMSDVDAKLFDLSMAGASVEQLERAKELLMILEDDKDRREGIADSVERQKKELEQLNSLLESTPTAQLEKLREDMKFLADAFEKGRISAEEFNEAATARIGLTTTEAEKGFEDLERAIDGFAKNSADALADFAFGAQGSFTDMVNSFLKDLARLALQKSIFDPLSKGIGDIFSGGGFGDFFSGFFGGARANGGPVSSGSAYLVGERGPEMFVPNTSGKIIPNGQGGGQTNQVSITINEDGTRSQQGSSSEIARQIEGAVMSVLLKQKRQGGLLA
jgi:phage-related minor tail protein